jgi:hypothetical protein
MTTGAMGMPVSEFFERGFTNPYDTNIKLELKTSQRVIAV